MVSIKTQFWQQRITNYVILKLKFLIYFNLVVFLQKNCIILTVNRQQEPASIFIFS